MNWCNSTVYGVRLTECLSFRCGVVLTGNVACVRWGLLIAVVGGCCVLENSTRLGACSGLLTFCLGAVVFPKVVLIFCLGLLCS